MALDPVWVATEAAAKLKVTVADAQPAADAAVEYVATYLSVPASWLPDDDPQLNIGSPLLAVRIFQDAAVPSGSTSSFDGFDRGSFVPLNLYSHLDQYWRFLVPVDPVTPPPVGFAGNWDYQAPATNTDPPGLGEIEHALAQLDEFRISKVDYDGSNRQTDFDTLSIGDTIAANATIWTIGSIVENSTWFNYGVTPTDGLGVTGVIAFTFEVVAP